MPSTYLALLRGVNVGGKNKLPMKELVQIFAEAGCGEVRSFIQSGNVVFSTESSSLEQISLGVTAAVAERFGFKTAVLLRTAEEIQEVVRGNPFLEARAAQDTLHVLFLAGVPEPHRVDSLDQDRSRPDSFVVRGQEVYLWLPNGVARTRLTNAYFDERLATTSTGRNWRTVKKLLALMTE